MFVSRMILDLLLSIYSGLTIETCDGWLPLLERKQELERLFKKAKCREILYAHHIVGKGIGLFKEICARDLEGIIAKPKNGIYRDDGKDGLN